MSLPIAYDLMFCSVEEGSCEIPSPFCLINEWYTLLYCLNPIGMKEFNLFCPLANRLSVFSSWSVILKKKFSLRLAADQKLVRFPRILRVFQFLFLHHTRSSSIRFLWMVVLTYEKYDGMNSAEVSCGSTVCWVHSTPKQKTEIAEKSLGIKTN